MEKIPVTQWKLDKCYKVNDDIAHEQKLELSCDKYNLTTYMTPEEITEFITGHLASIGIISKAENIRDIVIRKENETIYAKVVVNNGKYTSPKIKMHRPSAKTIYSINRYVTNNTPLFLLTGAFHYAFIFASDGTQIKQGYDIGRFNAIDKACGKCIIEEIPLSDKILYTTGRISQRTVEKAIALNIPYIISKAPPFYESIVKAKDEGITIIGFSREKRFTIYTG